MKKKKDEITIRSSAAEYLTYVASVGNQQNSIEIRYEDENIWLTQKMMATLYDVDVRTINEHIKRIYSDSELEEDSTIRNFRIVQTEGSRQVTRDTKHYNLQMIIAVGFKVNNARAVQFRKWANGIVKDYTIKGWVMDDERLKNSGSILTVEYFDCLLEQIREICLSERRFYQKITDIYATALDYDRTAKTTKQFFAKVQNKMHYAVHGHTATVLLFLKESRENMSEKLLIVEDDKKLNDGIRLALKNDAYFFYQCRTLQEARELLKKEDITLVLLDVNLPDGNGIDFVREIRKNSQVPIILLTVNNMEVDIVTGLEAGANDYITKPFSLMVLRARVSVQLRNKEAAAKNSMELDGFEFYFDKMEFFKDGEPIELSKTEQKLLRVLCENRGKVLKREYLIDEVWQGDTEFVDAHALTVAIKRLRDKLEDDTQKPEYIKTVYGIGYTWAVNG